ncbi:unnamed protein product [Laminaria digitata]
MTGGVVELITARFLALVLHLVATCTVFYCKVPLIQIEVDPDRSDAERKGQYEHIDAWVTALLALALLCIAVELSGVLSGFTFHQKNANIVSALAHLLGFLSTISMILNGWTVNVYPFVFTFCSLLPAGFDVSWWAFQAYTRKFKR